MAISMILPVTVKRTAGSVASSSPAFSVRSARLPSQLIGATMLRPSTAAMLRPVTPSVGAGTAARTIARTQAFLPTRVTMLALPAASQGSQSQPPPPPASSASSMPPVTYAYPSDGGGSADTSGSDSGSTDTSTSSDQSGSATQPADQPASGIDPAYGLDQTSFDNSILFTDASGNAIVVSDPNAYALLFQSDDPGDGGALSPALVAQSVNLAEQLFSSGDQQLATEQQSAWSAIQSDADSVAAYYQFDSTDSTGNPVRSAGQAASYRQARASLQSDINTWVSNAQGLLAPAATTPTSTPTTPTGPQATPVPTPVPGSTATMQPTPGQMPMLHPAGHRGSPIPWPWLLAGGLGVIGLIAFSGGKRA